MAKPTNHRKPTKESMHQNNQKKKSKQPPLINSMEKEKPPSWAVMRGIFSCKHQQQQQQQQPEKKQKQKQKKVLLPSEETSKKNKKMKCSGSLCSNTKVMHRPENASPEALQRKKAAAAAASMGHSNSSSSNNITSSHGSSSRSLLKAHSLEHNSSGSNGGVSSSTNSSFSAVSNTNNSGNSGGSGGGGGSFRGMGLSRFSGCYECRMVVDPVLGFTRDPSLRGSICSCPDCGEIFMKAENLELHQAVRHAVSELGPEDTSKNIVEIIFQSSWLKKETPICKIDRILKVHNTQRTISKFEEYRDSIKAKATKLPRKHPRCIADGNELLRFHSTTLTCSLGLNGSSNLCNSIPNCNVCSIIKNGFKVTKENNSNNNNGGSGSGSGRGYNGILTTATSGKAHDKAGIVMDDDEDEDDNQRRAMLVCRVIAGRVKKGVEGNMEDYDSVAGAVGMYSNLDELYVFNPKAILPCFVVIYSGF